MHRKVGGVGKWQFGLPLVYAAIDWAKAARRFLEACATVKASLAQISMTLTTKGGQQAMMGAKQQLSTTVGPSSSLWDQNPTAVDASVFASGPGTKLEAFNSKGGGGDPSEVREYKLQVAMVFGIPESFFSDMNTSNLATATSLDRPTELNFMAKQEEWREDLATIIQYVLANSAAAPNGKLREAKGKAPIRISEARRVRTISGRMVYESSRLLDGEIKTQVNFPTIIEADVPAQIGAVVNAMTLGQPGVNGIDEKAGVGELYRLVGIEDGQEILAEQYPDTGPDAYDPVRKDEPMPVSAPPVAPGADKPVKEALPEVRTMREAVARLSRAFRMLEAAQADADASGK
jgi:hypothetical protein